MTFYYSGKQAATSSYTEINLGFNAKRLVIQAASANAVDIVFSFDAGTTVHGNLEPGEPITLQPITIRKIWIKGDGGNANYRMWAWQKPG